MRYTAPHGPQPIPRDYRFDAYDPENYPDDEDTDNDTDSND